MVTKQVTEEATMKSNSRDVLKAIEEKLIEDPESLPLHSQHLRLLFESGCFKEVMDEAEFFLGIFPPKADAFEVLAEASIRLGDYDKAHEFMKRLIRLDPIKAGKLIDRTCKDDDEGKARDALIKLGEAQPTLFTSLLKQLGELAGAPLDSFLAMTQGILQERIGQHEEAIDTYEEILKDNPEDVDTLFMLATSYYQHRHYDKAIPLYQRILKVDEYYIGARTDLGGSYFNLGKTELAIAETKKALEINPEFCLAQYNLGRFLYEAGELAEAEEEYKKAIMLNPEEADCYYGLGNVYDKMDRVDDAIKYYQKALEINSQLVGVHHNLGLLYKRSGEKQKAISEWKRAVEKDSSYNEAKICLGQAYFEERQFGEAQELLEPILDEVIGDARAHNSLALCYRESGDTEKAITLLNEAVDRDPTDNSSYVNLAIIYYRDGEIQRAVDILNKGLEKALGSAVIHETLGACLCGLDRLEEALSHTVRALELEEGRPNALYNLACIKARRGNPVEALDALESAIRVNDSFRSQARADEDFVNLRQNDRFLRLVGTDS